ncbi:hypothetical protein [Phycicoccus sp.]|uniref:hypothetical protein n=1 Tax=Phycicoccus sp. TaxID=1902410 RepID=UPI002C4DF084|nr:hypothetical protein [Phycicoccus sp.]HMM93979.1 hypothetical protein [Phycicoccus sp.]
MTITRSTRRVLFVYGLAGTTKPDSLLRGNILDWLRDEGIPAQWSNRLRGWRVRTERVGDIIARAESAGITVRMKGCYVIPPEPIRHGSSCRQPIAEVTVDGQLALLEVGEAS